MSPPKCTVQGALVRDFTYQQLLMPSSLTTRIHVDERVSVFIHYQMTMATGTGKDFHSKLLINYVNSGSVVHSGVHN